jgi:alkylhydroperoxidase family enzyme
MHLAPVPAETLPATLRALHDRSKEGGQRMIRVTGNAPEHAEPYWAFYDRLRNDNTLGPRLTEIIRVVAAGTTECQVCFGSERNPSSGTAGLGLDEMAGLADKADRFSTGERAVIRFTSKLGTDHLSIGPADFEALRSYYSERQIVEIGMLAAQFIGMGRLSAALAIEDPEVDADHAGARRGA